MTLKRKAIRSSILVFGKTLFQKGTNFFNKIVLAWLLVPADFGLVAISALVIDGIGLFREMGINSALIYKKDDEDLAADTAFILIFVISSILYAITFLFAPLVAEFFNEPLVTDIIRVSALSFLITAIGFVPLTLLEKKIEFRNYVTLDIASTVIGVSSMILMALFGFGVWSIVYSGLIVGISGSCGVWFLTPWRPKFRFDRKIAFELIGYGKFMVGLVFVIFMIQNIDNATIGKVIGASMLGLYVMAYSICNLPSNTVVNTINQVLFPTYSKIQDDKEKLRIAYIKVFNLVSMLVFPLTFGTFIVAPEFVTVVLSEKWQPMIPIIQVLCFFGLFRALAGTTGEMFKALGKPKMLFKSYGAQLVIIALLIYPATTSFGVIGTSIVITLSFFLVMIWLLSNLCNALKIQYNTLGRISGAHLVSSIIMIIIVYAIKTMLGMNIVSLITSILVGALVYALAIQVLTRGGVAKDIHEVIYAIKQRGNGSPNQIKDVAN